MRFGHRFESRYYQRSSLNDGLIAAWPLDEASGTRYPDYGGSAFDLTDVNTVGTAAAPTGIGGVCASFNGSNEYLYCADPFSPLAALSVVAWVYPTSVAAGDKTVVQQGRTGAGNFSFGFIVVTAAPTFYLSANGTAVSNDASGNLSANTWQLIVGVWDGATITAYTNITPSGSPTAFSSALYNSAATLQIGANDSPFQFFPGRIAQPLIYNRALSLADITYIYNSGNGRPLSDWLV